MVFCNGTISLCTFNNKVTILILVDGFLQLLTPSLSDASYKGHNPYFSRWFSAIVEVDYMNKKEFSHNPYFSRWFSAIALLLLYIVLNVCHNPYFSRWFSAIKKWLDTDVLPYSSQSLF